MLQVIKGKLQVITGMLHIGKVYSLIDISC